MKSTLNTQSSQSSFRSHLKQREAGRKCHREPDVQLRSLLTTREPIRPSTPTMDNANIDISESAFVPLGMTHGGLLHLAFDMSRERIANLNLQSEEQLELKPRSAREMVEVLVVDHWQLPFSN
jgi:hypothetical protein